MNEQMRDSWLLEEAIHLGEQILENRVRTRRGHQTWLAPTGYGTEIHPLRVAPLGIHLYDGLVGVALFLAALGRVSGVDIFRRSALEAVGPLRRLLAEAVHDQARSEALTLPIGGLIGIGSLIYGLLKISDLLGETEIASEAHVITELLTPERIARDRRVRIQTGAAGAILALIALQKNNPAPNRCGNTPVEVATMCARHLLKTRCAFDGLPPAWPLSPGKPPLIGFSYGAAGISYALLRLFRIAPDQELLDAARDGLDFVRCFYDSGRGSWADVRITFEERYHLTFGTWKDWWASGSMSQLIPCQHNVDQVRGARVTSQDRRAYLHIWCHGAAGIAMGRLGALDGDDSSNDKGEIERALDFTYSRIRDEYASATGADDICCGRMGQIEVFHEAARRLGADHWRQIAIEVATETRDLAHKRGRYNLSAARGTGVFSPTLFQGLAGVGYTLLRLVDPETVPCVLLLE